MERAIPSSAWGILIAGAGGAFGNVLAEAVTGLSETQRVLVTLSACFGGLGLSHVNDAGFWVVTCHSGLLAADGLKTWTVLTTVMGLTGFVPIWLLSALL